MERPVITIRTSINASIGRVWKCWTDPGDILRWNQASEDWHTTQATNELHVGGRFSHRMEAKDGSAAFDFEGVYDQVILHRRIEYTLADGRMVRVLFTPGDRHTVVEETFEAEEMNSLELQQAGWQSILDNFRQYVEGFLQNP